MIHARLPHAGRARLALAATALLVTGLAPASLLPGLAPTALAAGGPTLTTKFPAVVVAPGANVSFDVDVATADPQRVELQLSGVPAGWTATIHGGGFVVDAVQTDGKSATTVRVDVGVPPAATGSSTLTLTARAGGVAERLPLQIRAEASASGDVTLSTDFPSLRGPASQTFSFNLTLANKTAEDLTFAVNAQGPTGWDVEAKLTGQSQAASAVVKAGSTAGVTVSAKAPDGVEAGTYPIEVVATAGSRQIPGTLQVEVTGSYGLALTTPTGRLNGNGTAGQSSDLALTVTNTGTAAVTNVKLTVTPPTGWKVEFDPATIDALEPGATQDVTAKVVPSTDAIAGDYVVTLKASGDQSTTSSADIRFTVETSLQWAIVGIALIVAVGIGLWWVYRSYGRR